MGAIKSQLEEGIPMSTEIKHGKGVLGKILAVLLIVLSIAIISAMTIRGMGSISNNSAVKDKQYQAVFLTNGQVYFGKVSRVTGDYIKLASVYYLQVQQTVQPTDKAKTTSTDSSAQQQVSLAKLGGELHGPEDAMYINRSQVLFWENLKNDGKVVKAIKEYTSK
jgi:hypothetical protein